MDVQETPKTSSEKPGSETTNLYAAQCEECFKWRLISTQEEFGEIQSKLMEEPFYCRRKTDTFCDDPIDIEYDASRTWVIHKPNIPKTPTGFKKIFVLRKDNSKMDVYYITPTGKKVRSPSEMASFIEANPKYKDLFLPNFNFQPPRVMEDTIPQNVLENHLLVTETKN